MASGLFNLKQVNQAISQGAWSGYIAPRWVEYLVVAGGGGGGCVGGGAGAGGLLTGIVTVSAGASYTVTIGSGGSGGPNTTQAGSNGVASVFGAISTTGGGGGGSNGSTTGPSISSGRSGGSGGGVGSAGIGGYSVGQGTSGQGNAGGNGLIVGTGYPSGGGGGAGTVGISGSGTTVSGNGGAGIASAITGSVVTYAGGGGGGSQGGTAGTGGVGGGGSGTNSVTTGATGGGNTGGGGGGGGYGGGDGLGGAGGSGIVVVRYPGNVQFYTGGTVTYSNGYIVHNFTANGTLAPTTPTVVSEYQISRSLRFNSADSTYLVRTPSSNGSQTTSTASLWVKRSVIGAEHRLIAFDQGGSGTIFWLFFNTSNQLQIYTSGTAVGLTTTQVFRDPSAWYHIVVGIDTTQATGTDRIKLYVNGSQITAFTGTQTYYSQGASIQFNNTGWPGQIGYNNSATLSGYMTEVNWIDGQQLTPTSFGYVNPTTGVWSPAKYVGGYGTNGFYLNFSDNSNTTAATLGADYSGNGNNWTPNNFSVTAGAGNDSLVDSPTSYGTDTGVGGEVRGNYATLNPLKFPTGTTISNGNLNLTGTTSTYFTGLATISPSSGNYYMEMLCTGTNTNRPWGIGVVEASASSQATVGSSNSYFVTNNSGSTTNYFLGSTATALSTSSTWIVGDIISLAWNVDSGKFWVARNGVWYPSSTGGTVASNADVAAGNFPTFTISYSANTNPQVIPAFVTYDTTAPVDVNFGQRPFAYTAPSGFKALCTQNLPTPTIGATSATLANKYFDATLYTGTGSTLAVTNTGGFQPDWVWLKNRSNVAYHSIWDAVRGRSAGGLASNDTGAEQASTAGNDFVSFNSNGFSVGPAQNWNVDTSGNTYVGWQWKANGSGSSNTAGSITSTVSANTTSGFSVVTYTGTGANATVGHGLGVAPSMLIQKNRASGTALWFVYHRILGATKFLRLNADNAEATNSGVWNNTAPTSSVISIGSNSDINGSGQGGVFYCFAEVAGYSAFGSYTGNGSADGPFVFTGMRPAYVMVKRTNDSGNWQIFDDTRSPINAVSNLLSANSSSAESSDSNRILDFVSNGFKLRVGAPVTGDINASGSTYIYACFAKNPFKYSLAR